MDTARGAKRDELRLILPDSGSYRHAANGYHAVSRHAVETAQMIAQPDSDTVIQSPASVDGYIRHDAQ